MVLHSQSVYVSVAHRYWNPRWSEERNRQVYGRLCSVTGVGSNLKLTLAVEAPADPRPGLLALKSRIDHRALHLDFDEFKDSPSTVECIAVDLARHVPGPWRWLQVSEGENFAVRIEQGQPDVQIEARVLNLTLRLQRPIDPESGLAIPRDELWRSLTAVAPEFAEPRPNEVESMWGERLAKALGQKLPGLHQVVIDMSGQRFLQIRL